MSTEKKKRRYRRSTPIGRLRRNVQKIGRHAGLMKSRILAWKTETPELILVSAKIEAVEVAVAVMDGALESLERSNWSPPPRSSALEFVPGQHVAISQSHLEDYKAAFEDILRDDPEMLDDLVVDKVLLNGKIVVRRGKRTPFPVSKSHLVPLELDDDEES
jgi:hypothetical protein